MSNWRVLYDRDDLSVGMWKEDGKVYLTLKNLQPEDVIDQEPEIELSIEELEKIIVQAKVYEKEIADD